MIDDDVTHRIEIGWLKQWNVSMMKMFCHGRMSTKAKRMFFSMVVRPATYMRVDVQSIRLNKIKNDHIR